MPRFFGLLLALFAAHAHGAALKCFVGAKCVESQGTKIPVAQVVQMLDSCSDFIENDIGARVLRMTIQQINNTPGRVNSIKRASFAFEDLYDSPLQFERKSKAEETSYAQIKRSCFQLERDFYNTK